MKVEAPATIPFSLTDNDREAFSLTWKLLRELFNNMRDDSSVITCDGDIVCDKHEVLDAMYILDYFSIKTAYDWHIVNNQKAE